MISDFQNPNLGPPALELQNNVKQYLRFLQKKQTFCQNNYKTIIVCILQWLYTFAGVFMCSLFLVISFIAINVSIDISANINHFRINYWQVNNMYEAN